MISVVHHGPESDDDTTDAAAAIVDRLIELGRTVAVAESLTGGQVISALIDRPGASAAVSGGVVAYATALKISLLGVDRDVLAARGAVDARVAELMAEGVRTAAAVEGARADYGVATTGVAGPDPQGSAAAGLVFVAVADDDGTVVRELHLDGDRGAIRTAASRAALSLLAERLAVPRE
jgi:nicotinamide-nucleotide amidase